ncbi:MAG: hypothetical protein WCW56_01000 [Candidatus Paceibacterota bacterium]|jgi:hypothetical protein
MKLLLPAATFVAVATSAVMADGQIGDPDRAWVAEKFDKTASYPDDNP